MKLSTDVARPSHNVAPNPTFAREPQISSPHSLPYGGQSVQGTSPYARPAIGSPTQYAANATVPGASGSPNAQLSPTSGRLRHSSIGVK